MSKEEKVIYNIPKDDLEGIYKCLGCNSQIGRRYHVEGKIDCGCPRGYGTIGRRGVIRLNRLTAECPLEASAGIGGE